LRHVHRARRLPQGNLTNWYYSSSKHSSAADVKKECPDDFLAAGAK